MNMPVTNGIFVASHLTKMIIHVIIKGCLGSAFLQTALNALYKLKDKRAKIHPKNYNIYMNKETIKNSYLKISTKSIQCMNSIPI